MERAYTSQMETTLYCKWGEYDSAEDDYSEIISQLNSPDFRSFGEGLSAIIMPKAKRDEMSLDCLKRQCKDKNIDITKELASVNTLKSWFSGGERPKKSDESRRKMFVIAFALELNADETAYLFQRVFLDRAFNFRNAKELIYYYCIENHLSLSDAEQMTSQVNFCRNIPSEQTVYTDFIKLSADKAKSGEELIAYINAHPHNFSVNNIAAKKALNDYLAIVKADIAKEIENPFYDDIKRGKDTDSTRFMYEIITGVDGGIKRESVFKNAELPKEICVSFPSEGTFSKQEPTYDELRKMLILLFSYHYWYYAQKTDNVDIDDYSAQLNDLLTRSGLPTLYPGNPFDWMFFFCTLEDMPLDTFRGIIAEINEPRQ